MLYLERPDFQMFPNQPNQWSKIAEAKVPFGYAYKVLPEPLEIYLSRKNTHTSDATAGNAETFNLDYDLIDSPNLGDDKGALWLYDDDTLVAADSLDYAANTYTYTDPATGSTLESFGIFAEGSVRIRGYTPNKGRHITLFEKLLRMLHGGDIVRTPPIIRAIYPRDILPEDFRLTVELKSSAVVPNAAADLAKARNYVIKIPIERLKMEELPKDIKRRVLASMFG